MKSGIIYYMSDDYNQASFMCSRDSKNWTELVNYMVDYLQKKYGTISVTGFTKLDE